MIVLGCHSHARRYAFKAVADGDQRAEVYLAGFNQIFKIDRICRRFRFDQDRKHEWRLRYSLPIFDLLVAMAEGEIAEVPPKTRLWDCLHYLIAQQEPLRRCITTPGAELTNNAVERTLRPLKSGQKYGKMAVMESRVGGQSVRALKVASPPRSCLMKYGDFFRGLLPLDRQWQKNVHPIRRLSPISPLIFA